MVRNGQLVNEPGYVTNVITDEALMLIDQYADADTPFYLSVHLRPPRLLGEWQRNAAEEHV